MQPSAYAVPLSVVVPQQKKEEQEEAGRKQVDPNAIPAAAPGMNNQYQVSLFFRSV
jgi:hypothetical protein